MLEVKEVQTLSEQEKTVSLFEFIKELNKLKQKVVLNIRDYPWHLAISDIPVFSEYINVSYRDRVEEESETADDLLLSIRKPEFEECPIPDELFADWLVSGWGDYHTEADVMPERNITSESPDTEELSEEDAAVEQFEDNSEREAAYQNWQVPRTAWADRQHVIEKTRELFTDLYQLYFELQREAETEEIIVANGMFRDAQNPDIAHPVLTHRVQLEYDAMENVISIHDTESSSELYSVLFQMMEDINLDAINHLNDDLRANDYHPLDRTSTPDFLKALVRQLSSDSIFSAVGVPAGWSKKNRLLLYLEPCYIVRKRLDGTPKAIEKIIENIQQTGFVPAPISDIVSGGKIDLPEDDGEESIEEQLAAVGGESVDVLLSKEANKEQLEIAHRIEQYNAVLVQGPPGTGKTHTIANLMGHFLAQGKSVLVTSHTKKALSVLKEKVAPGLQSLCVSILDDSNLDMERSVDGITDYMSKTTSHEMQREMNRLAGERKEVIDQLANVRRKIFAILNQECSCIVYNGEEFSPSKAAEFVLAHADDLSYIPGKVRLDTPLPLTFEQLTELYRSNRLVSESDEEELLADLPDPSNLLPPAEFDRIQTEMRSMQDRLKQIEQLKGWTIHNRPIEKLIDVDGLNGQFTIFYPKRDALQALSAYVHEFSAIDPWMKSAAVDGKNGGSYLHHWELLIEQIEATCRYAETLVEEQFGVEIVFVQPDNASDLKTSFEALKTVLGPNGKIPTLTRMFHKDYVAAHESVKINSKLAQSVADCDLVLHAIELKEVRQKCATYWDELLATQGVPKFFELDASSPERIAHNWIPHIQKYLNWYQDDYAKLSEKLMAAGIPADQIFGISTLDSDLSATSKILGAVEQTIPKLCDVCSLILDLGEREALLRQTKNLLLSDKRVNSTLCTTLASAITDGDAQKYMDTFSLLEEMYGKYALQRSRMEMLSILKPIAPQWADAIQNRDGIHGSDTVPDTIEDAWKWKQLSGRIDEITKEPFEQLQADSLRLSKEYRSITAEYAEKCGWYHLLRRTEADIDMKQALQGWKQTVKRIGKGTGKTAPALKAKARELMSKCQVAVPCWIMPISRALESLNPKENQFDIVIIDEASQSDVSSLAILYMGKKLIIVGDDKQVSPMAVGTDTDKMSALEQMYLHDKIPNSHLYNAKTSIYDIATTTFQPLMLREHFRCVPEIIGFSNMLSYDYKIKPLRDASSSTLLPAVVNYRVADGQRMGRFKTNPKEAEAIVALMKACMEQDEYQGKTFGVISLLGDEQVKIIQREIEQEIDAKEIVSRNILCGNSANFQGDERDVVFLSLVDSGDGTGPLSMMGFGVDDAMRKRYNVAASRARDQLWVVHSLDAANDLKPGDMRKRLIDYAANPHALDVQHTEIEAHSESPFELAVATNLSDRGYHLVQQWKVGAYRLDMVALCGKKMVAIECDGERWHSGEEKVREDMERQTILERLGWRFIRIRGSEYYRAPEETMERVVSELTAFGIEPETAEGSNSGEQRSSELLSRVKLRAAQIIESKHSEDDSIDLETIQIALDPKSIVPKQDEEKGSSVQMEAVVEQTIIDVPGVEPELPAVEVVPPQKAATRKTPKKSSTAKSQKAPTSKVKNESQGEAVQQVMPGMDISSEDILTFLKNRNVHYVDKRSNGGALWIIGGHELDSLVAEAKNTGILFHFKMGGGNVTKGKDGWWFK